MPSKECVMNEEPKSASLCSVRPFPADGPACKGLAGMGGGGVFFFREGGGGGLIDLAFELQHAM